MTSLTRPARLTSHRQLLDRALEDLGELGPKPRSGLPRWEWDRRRREALIALAGLADHDPTVLRRAALVPLPATRRQRAAVALLQDATYFAWRSPREAPVCPR
jgi:hypothetical protein